MVKRWFPASFIAVAIALALAGGVVLAVGGGDDGHRSGIFERAAQILGIDPSQLEGAHDRATRELRDEKLASVIEKLVLSGLIEQGEADSVTAWMADRPDSVDDALLARLMTPAFKLHAVPPALLQLPKPGLWPGGNVIERMAEILGVDEQELIDALENGARDSDGPAPSGSGDSGDRLAAMHAAIDNLLESGSVTPVEATELHNWIDEIPQWLLDIDLSSRILPALGFGWGERVVPGELEGFRFRLPSGRDHFPQSGRYFFFGDDNRRFDFEFRGPEGTFRFGPGGFGSGEHDFPFDDDFFQDERFRDFFDRFDFDGFPEIEGLEGFRGLENLEDLLEGFREFRGHGFFSPPPVESGETGDDADSSPTAA